MQYWYSTGRSNTTSTRCNKSFQQNADAPKRFLPCLTAGLAYYMGLKRPNIPGERLGLLKQNYEELLKRAMEEDKERASIFLNLN